MSSLEVPQTLGVESSSSEEEVETQQYKVILLGDGAVGKTSIAQRFSTDTFGKVYKQTIGVDFLSKQIDLPGGVRVIMQTWDIGGQGLGSKMLRNYIFGASAVLMCYDITNLSSFLNLEDWLREVQATFGSTPTSGTAAAESPSPAMPYLALVGNKTDLGHLRAVKPQRHKDFADAHQMHSFFLSAKSGDNVAATFYRVAADLAGVVLTKPELQVASKVVVAEIIDHPAAEDAADTAASASSSAPKKAGRKEKQCAIQ